MTKKEPIAEASVSLDGGGDLISFGEAYGLLKSRIRGLTEGELFFMSWVAPSDVGGHSENHEGILAYRNGIAPPTRFDFNDLNLFGIGQDPIEARHGIAYRRTEVEEFEPRDRWISWAALRERWSWRVPSKSDFVSIIQKHANELTPSVPAYGWPKCLDEAGGSANKWAYFRVGNVERLERGWGAKRTHKPVPQESQAIPSLLNREDILWPLIRIAQSLAVDATSQAVFAALRSMANEKDRYPGLLGVTDKGIQYLSANDTPKELSIDALRKRINRVAEGR